MLSLRKEPPLPTEVLEEAAEWLMRLSENNLSDSERAEWQRWKVSTPERDRAWARAQLLQSKFGGLPPSLAMSALDRPSHPERRAALGKLALLLALMPVGWGSWKLAQSQQWTADYRTRVGERRELTLADGSHITLNTDTAIDVRFDSQQRRVHLREGEILVQTAQDASRPFLVSTRQGLMQALGTRFTVRELSARTHLAVLEGAVQVVLADNRQTAPIIVNAGQSTDFSAQQFGALTATDRNVGAWAQGMLMADNMRLADFVAELTRYRHGFVRYDPAIADLRISGAFPISDTQRTLNMLVQTYPVLANGHLNGYWVTLSPA
ncbi:FecR domain-containing protein [Pseudomonas fluorescens]|uniref:FecR domain-containing protein n=1 Tax=Pseudomonas fluorescens TaxID=294 RepID=UPI00178090DD|nr:FecR domain-containing protein [Pseudomonas fluorescens]MBD8194518.1 FecR domain-containing protein [Pseudomonas fluorescens]MBD8229360.1 FecR domain-containing protein [Pseudomonas fluorescens]MBD8787333.1 FecR domain-containing protein [Pseudomonas fluorescens]MBD8819680.1 FecR domain-containing protein [Pseudomonas fluorescens]